MVDLYASVVSRRVLAALHNGVIPWRDYSALGFANPWPTNAVTGKPYRGLNAILLWLSGCTGEYGSNHWLTRKQAVGVGAVVQPGASETVCLMEKGEGLAAFSLVNAAQVDGLALPSVGAEAATFSPGDIDVFVRQTGAFIGEFGSAALYIDDTDVVRLPVRESMAVPDDFFVLALRELARWTRHEDRLNREFRDRMGADAVAFEALVADMATGFLGADFSLRGTLPQCEFLPDWCQLFERDPETLLWAVRYAHQAYMYLMNLTAKRREGLLLTRSA